MPTETAPADGINCCALYSVSCCLQGALWPTTPLIYAAKMGHVDMVSLLMDRGAQVAATYRVGFLLEAWKADDTDGSSAQPQPSTAV